MKTISDRLLYLINYKGVTPYVVAQETGIAGSTLSRILNKGNKPNSKTVNLLSNYFQIYEHWLLTGKGNIWTDKPGYIQTEPAEHFKNVTEDERALAISTFKDLLKKVEANIKRLEAEPQDIEQIKLVREAHKLRLDIIADLDELSK